MAPVPGYQAPPHSCDPAVKTAAVGQNKVINELLFGVIPLASESTRGILHDGARTTYMLLLYLLANISIEGPMVTSYHTTHCSQEGNICSLH